MGKEVNQITFRLRGVAALWSGKECLLRLLVSKHRLASFCLINPNLGRLGGLHVQVCQEQICAVYLDAFGYRRPDDALREGSLVGKACRPLCVSGAAWAAHDQVEVNVSTIWANNIVSFPDHKVCLVLPRFSSTAWQCKLMAA